MSQSYPESAFDPRGGGEAGAILCNHLLDEGWEEDIASWMSHLLLKPHLWKYRRLVEIDHERRHAGFDGDFRQYHAWVDKYYTNDRRGIGR